MYIYTRIYISYTYIYIHIDIYVIYIYIYTRIFGRASRGLDSYQTLDVGYRGAFDYLKPCCPFAILLDCPCRQTITWTRQVMQGHPNNTLQLSVHFSRSSSVSSHKGTTQRFCSNCTNVLRAVVYSVHYLKIFGSWIATRDSVQAG